MWVNWGTKYAPSHLVCKAGSFSLLSISLICFYFISFLILKAVLKACPICSYRVLHQSFSYWQVIKCNFLDFNFFVPVCLFVYFTLILKVRMMMMIMMMVMKLSLFLLFCLNVRWFTWLKSSIPLMNVIADSLIFNHFPSTLQKLYLWSTQVVLTLNNIKIEFSTQVGNILTKIWRLVKCKLWCLRLVET